MLKVYHPRRTTIGGQFRQLLKIEQQTLARHDQDFRLL
jgi:hypothetical protein